MTLFFLFFAALFSVMNPLGSVPIFVSLTKDSNTIEIKRTAKWTAINIFIILVISYFVGSYILHFFGISISSLKIAGGLIIISSGFALLTGNFTEHKGIKKKVKNDAHNRSDIALTPLAIPMLAGPGTISLLISYHQEYNHTTEKLILIGVLVAVCVVIFLILNSAHYIVKYLGASGINALSRIIGFIIIAIGIEYILSSVIFIIQTIFT